MTEKAYKNTRYEYVQGKLSWVRLVKPDTAFEPAWTVTVHLTPESLEKVRELQAEGLKNVIKKDEDGYYTRFKCLVARARRDGTMWAFEAPRVVDKDGRPMDGSLVGDGSDATLKLEVYGFKAGASTGIAARLVGVRVENLIPVSAYVEEDGMSDMKDVAPLF